MHYWDASALVPLCVRETTTGAMRGLARKGAIITWCLSSVEIASAIERRGREGGLSAGDRSDALRLLRELSLAWTEICALEMVRHRALRLLASHSLRAADSLQLAAALVAVDDSPHKHHFVCLDRRLAEAAEREGFATLTGQRSR